MQRVVATRSRAFDKNFMSQFDEEYQKEFGRDAPVGGGPDHGNGYFGKKLSYGRWLMLNNAIRVHQHSLEMIYPTVAFIVVGALGYPLATAICCWTAVGARIWVNLGIVYGGPRSVNFGYSIHILAALTLFGLALASSFKIKKF